MGPFALAKAVGHDSTLTVLRRGEPSNSLTGVSLPRIDFHQKARDLKLTGLDHPLLVTKILACVSACVRERGLSCAELAGDGQLSIDTNAVDGPRQFRVTIRPDAFALIEHPERRERVALLFEADRGTMPLFRSEFVQSSFRKKVLAYSGLWRDRETLRELGAETFLVLTLTEREAPQPSARVSVVEWS